MSASPALEHEPDAFAPGRGPKAAIPDEAMAQMFEAFALLQLAHMGPEVRERYERLGADAYLALVCERLAERAPGAFKQVLAQAMHNTPAMRPMLDDATLRRQLIDRARSRLSPPPPPVRRMVARPAVVKLRRRQPSGAQRRRTPARGSPGRSGARLAAGDDDEPHDVEDPFEAVAA